jgi:outer membrane protein W
MSDTTMQDPTVETTEVETWENDGGTTVETDEVQTDETTEEVKADEAPETEEVKDEAAKLGISPYKAASIVNKMLADAGVLDSKTGETKKLPPQMFYNYTIARIKAGVKPYIGTIVIDGALKVDVRSLSAWTDRYIRKALAVQREFENDSE